MVNIRCDYSTVLWLWNIFEYSTQLSIHTTIRILSTLSTYRCSNPDWYIGVYPVTQDYLLEVSAKTKETCLFLPTADHKQLLWFTSECVSLNNGKNHQCKPKGTLGSSWQRNLNSTMTSCLHSRAKWSNEWFEAFTCSYTPGGWL